MATQIYTHSSAEALNDYKLKRLMHKRRIVFVYHEEFNVISN